MILPRRLVSTLAVSGAALLALAACAAGAARAATSPTPSGSPSATATVPATPFPRPAEVSDAALDLLNELGESPTVVTIGDSIMSGHGLTGGQDWPTLLAAASGASVTNLACSGAGFIAVGSCGSDFSGLLTQTVKADPAIVIVESSSNDLGETDAQIRAATAATIATLHGDLPNTLIVGLSTIWNEQTTVPLEVVTSSKALETAVNAAGGIYIDVGQPLYGHPELMQSDDVHPTAAGQALIARRMHRLLERAGLPL